MCSFYIFLDSPVLGDYAIVHGVTDELAPSEIIKLDSRGFFELEFDGKLLSLVYGRPQRMEIYPNSNSIQFVDVYDEAPKSAWKCIYKSEDLRLM